MSGTLFARLRRGGAKWLLLALLLLSSLAGRPLRAADAINIHLIAVNLPDSPYLGQTVSTTGIVIAVLNDGFYIENNSGWDANTCSSEGLFVSTPSITPSSRVALQQSVTVTGLVQPSNSSNYAGVQISIAAPDATNLIVNSSGNALPSVVQSSVLTAATSGTCPKYSANSFGQWLPFEGMRVNVPSSSSLLVTQGTGGTVDATAQTATTNGQFWAVFSTTRPTRTAGINTLDAAYASAPSGVTAWSGNPQLLLVDSTVLGGTALDASAGTLYTGSSELVGIVDYHVSNAGYTGLLLTSASVAALSQQGGASPVAAPDRLSASQITIATQVLDNLTASESSRMVKLSKAIIDYLKAPDILAVQGATPDALAALVAQIKSDGGPNYSLTALSTPDSDGLVNGFLVEAASFDGTPMAAQQLATATFTDTAGTFQTLYDRSPLLLKANILRKGISDFNLYVLNTSLLPRTNLSSATLSEAARLQRDQQAATLVTQLLEPMQTAGDHIVVAGGLNSYEFSDGYVDTVGILNGNEAASGTVWLYDANFNAATLVNSTTAATNVTAEAANPATSRYSTVESGTAVQTDHILYTSELAPQFLIDYARIGADFPVSKRYDTSTVARASSHDAVIAYFAVPFKTQTVVVTSGTPSYYDADVTFTATVNVIDEVTGLINTSYVPDGTVTFYDTDGVTKLGSATLSGGVAQFTYSKLTVGQHTIKAVYGGSESYLGYQTSYGTVLQQVLKDISSLTVSGAPNPSYYGQPATITATATSPGELPTGTVTFTDITTGASLGTATLAGGVGTLTLSSLAVGTHTIKADYNGDTTNTTATATYPQTVQINTSTIAVTSAPNPSYYGKSVTFTLTATGSYGTPTGAISILVDGVATYAATLSSGTATLTTTTLAVGSHAIVARYGGDGTHAAADSPVLTHVVLPVYATTQTLTCTPLIAKIGSTVYCTDAVAASSGQPSGTITYYDGSTALGTATVTAGSASFTLSGLAVGTHIITAAYSENLPWLASTSNTQTVLVLSSFTLKATPTAQSLYTGEAATYTITVVPGTQFTLDVALSCSGLPANSTCTFAPATVTGGSGTSKLVLQTTAPTLVSANSLPNWERRSLPLLAIVLLPWIKRRRRGLWTLLVLLAVTIGAVTACGGASTLSGGTTAGTYTVTVAGQATYSGVTIDASTPVTLTVKSLF